MSFARLKRNHFQKPDKRLSRRHAACCIALLLLAVVRVASAQSCVTAPTGSPGCGQPKQTGVAARSAPVSHHVGNPIDVLNGNKYQREDDYRAVGSSLMFSRHYNSGLADHDAGLGHGWRHSYQVYLTRLDANTVQIVQADARKILFKRADDSSDLYMSVSGVDGIVNLATTSDRHTGTVSVWEQVDGRRTTFRGSWAIEMSDGPDVLTLLYRQRRLHSITDALDRRLVLHYTEGSAGLGQYDPAGNLTHPNHLERLTLPDGSEILYRYDGRRNATETRYPEGALTTQAFTDTRFPHHLTEREDAAGIRTWGYDDQGRAIRFAKEQDGTRLSINYERDADDTGPGISIVSHANGSQTAYRWRYDSDTGDRILIDMTEKPCADCEPRVYVPAGSAGSAGAVSNDDQARESDTRRHDDGVLENTYQIDAYRRLSEPHRSTDTPHTTLYTDGQGRTVTITADRLGDVLDVSRDGQSLNRLKRAVSEGSLACSGSEGHGHCLNDLAELLDLKNDFTEDPSGQLLEKHQRRPRGIPGRTIYGSNRFCSLPAGRTCIELQRDLEMAVLSECAYHTGPCVSRWIDLPPSRVGLTQRDLILDNGFQARLFEDPQTGEIVVAFAGTHGIRDVVQDIFQFSGVATSQYRYAIRLAEYLTQNSPNSTFSYTGHSLGGGLATTASLLTGDQATVFNSASLHPDTAATLGIQIGNAPATVNNLTLDGEIITDLQDADYPVEGTVLFPEHDAHLHQIQYERNPAPGNRYLLPQPDYDWMQAQRARSSLLMRPEANRRHLMETVIESLLSVLETACGIPR